jgi:hypothetical protein
MTFTGRLVDPLDLKREDICLKDIAHALALKCRFGGHCQTFYSVAQHSCLAAIHERDMNQKALCLLHDAAEAYLFDIPRPLKEREEFAYYSFVELHILSRILDKYLPTLKRGSWEKIDEILLVCECQQLLTNWQDIPIAHRSIDQYIPIKPWTWQESERKIGRAHV